MTAADLSRQTREARRHESDYIDRTIATVRNHRDADNCWPQWANIFADDIEDLRAERDALAARVDALAQAAALTIREWDTNALTNHLYSPALEDLRAVLASAVPATEEPTA